MIIYNAAISACEKGHRPQQALNMLQKLQFRGLLRTVITYNAAISACETGQRPQQALHMLQKLQLRGLLRTVITYNAAIRAQARRAQKPQLCRLCSRSCSSEAPCAP